MLAAAVPLVLAAAVPLVLVACAAAGPGGSSAAPGAPDEPVSSAPPPAEQPLPPAPGPVLLDPATPLRDAVPRALESWTAVSDSELEVRFWNGTPECYGAGATVVEDEASVTVAVVTGLRADLPPDTACIDIAVEAALRVPLGSPLGDREVRDASRPQEPLPSASTGA